MPQTFHMDNPEEGPCSMLEGHSRLSCLGPMPTMETRRMKVLFKEKVIPGTCARGWAGASHVELLPTDPLRVQSPDVVEAARGRAAPEHYNPAILDAGRRVR